MEMTMSRMIQLAVIALIALPLATAAAQARGARQVVHTMAHASDNVVVVQQWPHRHPCRNWHRFCF
jgi:hypothetical protein